MWYKRKVIDADLDQEFCTLHTPEIAKKITVLKGLHLAYEAWNAIIEITTRNCFQYGSFILSPKKI